MRDRDSVILQKITQYADDISETIARFALTGVKHPALRGHPLYERG
jgi:hypothetical protein